MWKRTTGGRLGRGRGRGRDELAFSPHGGKPPPIASGRHERHFVRGCLRRPYHS